jgi:hypothetical protein
MLACQRYSGWKERKNERWGKGERKAGEVQEEHLKAKRISFIHEHL